MSDSCTEKLCNPALCNGSVARRNQDTPHLGHLTLMSLILRAIQLTLHSLHSSVCTENVNTGFSVGYQLLQEVSGWTVSLQGKLFMSLI